MHDTVRPRTRAYTTVAFDHRLCRVTVLHAVNHFKPGLLVKVKLVLCVKLLRRAVTKRPMPRRRLKNGTTNTFCFDDFIVARSDGKWRIIRDRDQSEEEHHTF